MKTLLLLALVAVAHIIYLFGVYGTQLFGLNAPYSVAVFIWAGLPTILACVAYYKIGSRWPRLPSFAHRASLAFAATLCSLYVGMYMAFNNFGT